jgi:excisionase family DNA binding protein
VPTDKPVLSYNLPEAAKAIGVSERTIANAIRSGDLPAYKRGRVLVLADDLLGWIKAATP